MRVGCVQINAEFSGQCYLPYSAGILQAYAQRHLARPEQYQFLLPVFRRDKVADAVAHLGGADIVAFSLYSWNERLSMAMAEAVKRTHPSTLVVCGGPQVPRHDRPWEIEEFHRKYPSIDLAVHGPGERAFVRILEQGLDGRWETLPSVSFLDGRGTLVQTERDPGFKDLTEVPEPYLEGIFDPLIAEHPEIDWIAIEETNRNCPFQCTFCGWGLLGAKPIMRPVEEVLRNIDWFADHRIGYVFVVDSNFGMFKERDIEIARYFAKTKKERGYPRSVNVQDGKNIEQWVVKVRHELIAGGIESPVVLALQSLHTPTLKAIKRNNIKTEPYRNQLETFAKAGIPTTTDIILGLPEESYESFTSGVSTVIEWGQHNRSLLLNVSMVPDAEMSHPDQRRQYEIETVSTPLINPHGRMTQEEFPETQELIIGTRTMPREEWVRARAFAYMTSLLHFDKLLQIPLVLCHEVGEVAGEEGPRAPRYKEMIELFLAPDLDCERFPAVTMARDFFLQHARAIQTGKDEYCHAEEWLDVHWPPDEYMFITLVRGGYVDQFYTEALELLTGAVAIDRALVDQALQLNGALLELPFRSGLHVVETGWNIAEVYKGALTAQRVPLMPGEFEYHFDWSQARWTSWDAWLEKVVWWRNRAGQYYLKSGIPTAVVRARNSEAAVPEDERRPVALPTPLPAGHYY
jgi:tRNA A37 methylthiotransferase MiaB